MVGMLHGYMFKCMDGWIDAQFNKWSCVDGWIDKGKVGYMDGLMILIVSWKDGVMNWLKV